MIYKQARLELRLSEGELEALDLVRGSATRSAWLRNQIHLAASRLADEGPVLAVPTITDAAYPGEPPMVDQAIDTRITGRLVTPPPMPPGDDPRAGKEIPPLIGKGRKKKPVESPATEEMPEEETVSTNDPEVTVKKHFHKRGVVITSRHDKGVQITTYQCAEPGCHHTLEG